MRYHSIERCSLVNLPGARTVLWTAGCPHHCEGCQNPSTWDPNGGKEFDALAKELLFSYLSEPYCSGITFSGGDPFAPYNRTAVGELVEEIAEKYPEKSIGMYTGYTWDEVLAELPNNPWLAKVDIVVEGRFDLAQRNVDRMWAGSDNQKVVDVKKTLETGIYIPFDT